MRSVSMRVVARSREWFHARGEFFSDGCVSSRTGMIAKAASYSLFGAAITKVRRRSRCAVADKDDPYGWGLARASWARARARRGLHARVN
jgi:hypothetical protein